MRIGLVDLAKNPQERNPRETRGRRGDTPSKSRPDLLDAPSDRIWSRRTRGPCTSRIEMIEASWPFRRVSGMVELGKKASVYVEGGVDKGGI